MPKKRENCCLECAEIAVEPYKLWEFVAPFLEKMRWISVTMFGMFKCSSCGKSFRVIG